MPAFRYRTLCSLSGLIFIVATAQASAQSCEPEKVSTKYPSYANKTVRVAASPTQPPYSFSDPNDLERLTGMEIEMIEATLKCAGVKYEFVKGTWAGLLQSMFSGYGDVMPGNVTYRADRAEKVDYILYARAGSAVTVPQGNPKKIVDTASLCGNLGTGTVGGSSQFFIERQSKICVDNGRPAIRFQPAVDAEAAFRQLPTGRVDFVIDDAGSSSIRVAKEPQMQIGFIATSDLVNGMVVPKGNAEMLRMVSEGLKILERNRTIESLMKKYSLPVELLIPVETRS